MVVGLAAQALDCGGDLRVAIAPRLQVCREQRVLDVGVGALRPVAEISPAEAPLEKRDHAVLGRALRLADPAHTRRTSPVSNTCIMPCFTARALASFASSAAISASMSESDGGDGAAVRRKTGLVSATP